MQKWNIRTVDYCDLSGPEKKLRRAHFWNLVEQLDLYETWVVHPAWIGLDVKGIQAEYLRVCKTRPNAVNLRYHTVARGVLCLRVDDLKQGNNDATS